MGTFYNNKLIPSCKTPNADMYCEYEDFKAFLRDKFILSQLEFDEVCGADVPVPSSGESSGSSAGSSASTEKADSFWLYIAIGLGFLVLLQLAIILFVVSKLKAKVRLNVEDESTF